MTPLRRYLYRALHADGRLEHGCLPAEDRDDLDHLLASQTATCLFASPLPWPERALPSAQLTECCFQLGQLLNAGIPLLEALAICRAEAGQQQLRAILHRVGHDLRHGLSLSQALNRQARHFDPGLVAAIRAAEHSGDLGATFDALYRHRHWLEQFRRQLGQNLLAPLLGGIASGGACLFLLVHIAPQLQQFSQAQGMELPAATRWLVAGLPLLQTPMPWLIVCGILMPAIYLLLRLEPQRTYLHRWLLKLPLFGNLWLQFELARFCRTLGLLYEAGLPLLAGLTTSSTLLRNQSLHSACGLAIKQIHDGQSLSAAFAASTQFPPLFIRLIAVGEQAGRLGESLHTLAEHFTQQAQARMRQIQDLLPPLLTVLVGLLLILTVWSVITPLHHLLGALGGGR